MEVFYGPMKSDSPRSSFHPKPSPLLVVYTAKWLHKNHSHSLIPLASSTTEVLLQQQVVLATALANKMDMQVPARNLFPKMQSLTKRRHWTLLIPFLLSFFCMFLGLGV